MSGESSKVTGMVLSSAPVGENDKRVTLLTREMGKVYAFARGARRQGSPLLAATGPFALGTFHIYEGRSSFVIEKAEISHYFREIVSDPIAPYFGFYFLELADYFSFENLPAKEELSLLFFALKALLMEQYEDALVRRIVELKTLQISGEYPDPDRQHLSGSADYAMRFIIESEVKKCFTFALTEEVLSELAGVIDRFFLSNVRHEFRSLAILKEMIGLS